MSLVEHKQIFFKRQVLGGAIVLLGWVMTLVLYPQLPENFPRHTDFYGVVARWGPTTFRSVFALPLLNLFVLVSLAAIVAVFVFIRDFRILINFPGKRDLSEKVIEQVRNVMVSRFTLLEVFSVGWLTSIQWTTLRAAMGKELGIAWILNIIFVGLLSFALVSMLVQTVYVIAKDE